MLKLDSTLKQYNSYNFFSSIRISVILFFHLLVFLIIIIIGMMTNSWILLYNIEKYVLYFNMKIHYLLKFHLDLNYNYLVSDNFSIINWQLFRPHSGFFRIEKLCETEWIFFIQMIFMQKHIIKWIQMNFTSKHAEMTLFVRS